MKPSLEFAHLCITKHIRKGKPNRFYDDKETNDLAESLFETLKSMRNIAIFNRDSQPDFDSRR